MKISVVIPVYNGERYLEQALKSVFAQEFPAHEVIVINDGSTDGTQRILDAFKGRVISKTISNGGVANAMNQGLSLVTGDWVAFLDHDDVWFKNKLSRQADEARRAPSAGFICSNYAVRPNGLKRRMVAHYSRLDVLRLIQKSGALIAEPIPVLLHENIVGTSSSAMIRMDIVRQVGKFNPVYRISGDYDFWLRCSVFTSFAAVPDILFYKRTHAANISNNEILTLAEQRAIMKEFMTRHADQLRISHYDRRALVELAAVEYRLGSLCFESGKTKEAFEYYSKARRTMPGVSNAAYFLWVCFKKSLRLISGDVLSRKRWAG